MRTLVDVVIACVLLEATGLAAYRVMTGRGIALPGLVANLAAGLGLALALHFALTPQVPAAAIAACLVISLAGHVADLVLRWPRESRSPRWRS